MKRQTPMTLLLQQQWRHDGEQPAPPKPQNAPKPA
jgi:hypothetical protein